MSGTLASTSLILRVHSNGHDSCISLQCTYISLFSHLRGSSPSSSSRSLTPPCSPSLLIPLTHPLIPLAHRLQQRVLPVLKVFLAKTLIMFGTSSQSWTMVTSIPSATISVSLSALHLFYCLHLSSDPSGSHSPPLGHFLILSAHFSSSIKPYSSHLCLYPSSVYLPPRPPALRLNPSILAYPCSTRIQLLPHSPLCLGCLGIISTHTRFQFIHFLGCIHFI